jgi:hypothetical protein
MNGILRLDAYQVLTWEHVRCLSKDHSDEQDYDEYKRRSAPHVDQANSHQLVSADSRQHPASNRYPPLNLSPLELVNPLIALHAIVLAATTAIANHI